MMLAAMSSIISYTEATFTVMGWMAAESPRIKSRLKTLEPTAFPTASPVSPFLAATMEVTSSGREVPTATMVRPISVSDIPKVLAISFALNTGRRR